MQNTSEIDALIMRNIGEIELAHERIEGHLEVVLTREAGKVFRSVASAAGWHCKADSLDDDFWMAKPAWKIRRGEPDDEADYLLVLALDWDSTKPEASWPGIFVGSRGSRLLVRLDSDKFTPARWSRFLEEVAVRPVVAKLRRGGLVHDPNNKAEPFAIDVTSDPEDIALAFEGEEQFEQGLNRLKGALLAIVAMDEELEELSALVRAARA